MTITQNKDLTEKAGELAAGLDELLDGLKGNVTQETSALLAQTIDLLFKLKREGVFNISY